MKHCCRISLGSCFGIKASDCMQSFRCCCQCCCCCCNCLGRCHQGTSCPDTTVIHPQMRGPISFVLWVRSRICHCIFSTFVEQFSRKKLPRKIVMMKEAKVLLANRWWSGGCKKPPKSWNTFVFLDQGPLLRAIGCDVLPRVFNDKFGSKYVMQQCQMNCWGDCWNRLSRGVSHDERLISTWLVCYCCCCRWCCSRC